MSGLLNRTVLCLPLFLVLGVSGCAATQGVFGPPPADMTEAEPPDAPHHPRHRPREIVYAQRTPGESRDEGRSGFSMSGPGGAAVPIGPQSVSTDTQVSYGHSVAAYGH